MNKSNKTVRSKPLTLWRQINWKDAQNFLSTIQNRLVIAVKKGDENEIKRLQHQILQSFNSRALAVRRVTSNRGKRTSGVDKKLWASDEEKIRAVHNLKHLKEYKAQPVKKIWIDKPGKTDKRPLGIPTLFDRAVQALHLQALDPIVETKSDPRSFGFRKYRSVRDAAAYLKLVCGSMYGKRYILEVDIKQFFPSISHEWLLEKAPMDSRILREFLKAGMVEITRFSETTEGVPQGGIISPTLSNLVLNGLEERIKDISGTYLVRYADDFVVLGDDEPSLQLAKLQIEQFLSERKLQIHEEKTKLTTIEEGFDFLGYHFKEYKDRARIKGRKKGIFLVTPSKKNVASILKASRKVIKENKNATAGKLIQKLNPMLRGWAEHFRSVSSRKAFRTISKELYKGLTRWMVKRHREEARRELVKKYFKTVTHNHKINKWVFFGKNDRGDDILLFQIGNSTMKRHKVIAITEFKNPYLIEDQAYFEGRRRTEIRNSVLLDKKAQRLLTKQKGLCFVCAKAIESEEKLEIHHIKPVKEGGSNNLDNLVVAHWDCHRQIHSKSKKSSGRT